MCGDAQTSERDRNAITNPIVIIEVLSESSEVYDRGLKFEKYRELLSLQEYVLISQESHAVDVFRRNDEGWQVRFYRTLEDVVELKSLGIRLDMAAIYRGV